jgi:uncharacterized protein YukJ
MATKPAKKSAKKSAKKPQKPAKKPAQKKGQKAAKTHGVPSYGVLRGVVVQHGREDGDASSPHLQLIVEAKGERWRCAINVLSSDAKASPEEKEVRFAIVDPLTSHPILGRLGGLAAGFTPLPERKTGSTLDFVREPLFKPEDMQHLPFFRPGVGDDLQDLLEVYVNKAEGKPATAAEVFVWGSKFSGGTPRPADQQFKTKQGVHNVHMNQGNPAGAFFGDNGIFQDGGVIFRFPDRVVGVFLRFESQTFLTDDTGAPRIPGKVIDSGLKRPAVAIVAAVANPGGEESGHETVTLIDTLALPVNLAGWTIKDQDGNSDSLNGVQLRGGEAKLIVLTGQGARLGNNGGAISLLDRDGVRIHSVTYSKEDVAEPGRTILF